MFCGVSRVVVLLRGSCITNVSVLEFRTLQAIRKTVNNYPTVNRSKITRNTVVRIPKVLRCATTEPYTVGTQYAVFSPRILSAYPLRVVQKKVQPRAGVRPRCGGESERGNERAAITNSG